MTTYVIFASGSVFYAWRINTRPGMSTDVRTAFVRRHRNYVFVYIATWLPYYGFSFYMLFVSSFLGDNVKYSEVAENEEFSTELYRWLAAWNYLCLLTGLVMSIVRIREPVFWSIVKTKVYQYFGELIPEEQASATQVDGTLLSFLMSSLNIELVHIILTTVSKNTVGTPKSENNYKVYQNYDHTNKNTFVLDSIEI